MISRRPWEGHLKPTPEFIVEAGSKRQTLWILNRHASPALIRKKHKPSSPQSIKCLLLIHKPSMMAYYVLPWCCHTCASCSLFPGVGGWVCNPISLWNTDIPFSRHMLTNIDKQTHGKSSRSEGLSVSDKAAVSEYVAWSDKFLLCQCLLPSNEYKREYVHANAHPENAQQALGLCSGDKHPSSRLLFLSWLLP